MVAPHDATQDMQRRMGAHEPMPPLPVDLGMYLGFDCGKLSALLHGVPDVVGALLRADDSPRAARLADQLSAIGRLPAAAGIEDGPVQEHGVRVGIGPDHDGIGLAGVGVGVTEVLAHTNRLAFALAECAACARRRKN